MIDRVRDHAGWWLFVLVPLLVAGVFSSCARFGGKDRPRNLILIAVDTLRQDHLGCYGYGRGDSKAIDGMARRGVMFTEVRTAVPLTLPSFSSIFTSTYPLYHGIRQNETFSMVDSVTTLAEVFQRAGFQTKAILGSAALSKRYGLDQGFDDYDDRFEGRPSGPDRGSIVPDEYGSASRRRAPEVMDRAVEWIGEHGDDRFFLFLHFFDPHLPYDSEEKLPLDAYGDDELPAWAYDSEIATVDRQIARLLETLRERHLIGITLIVFTADHGEGLMDHWEATHGYLLYDSTVHIPLIFFCPGLIPEGKVVDGTVRSIDLMPTLIDVFGLPAPGGLQGVSFKDQIFGAAGGDETVSYFETYYARLFLGWSELRGVQWKQWKYIQAPTPELYDLGTDPGEEVNLVDRRPEIAAAMRARLDGILKEYSAPAGRMARPVRMDAEHKELLESMGYLTEVVDVDADTLLPDPKAMMKDYIEGQIDLGRIRIAGLLVQAGEYDRGIRILEGLKMKGEREWMVHYTLGLACMGKSDVARAGEEFRKALEIAPIGPERVRIREAMRYLETTHPERSR